MKQTTSLVAKVANGSAHFLSRIAFSVCVFTAVAVICLQATSFSYRSFLDSAIIYMASKARGVEQRQAEVAIISVDDDLLAVWQNNAYKTQDLSVLLTNILHASSAKVGVFFEREPSWKIHPLEKNKARDIRKSEALSALIEQKFHLLDLLDSPRVLLGFKSPPLLRGKGIEPDQGSGASALLTELVEYFQECKSCDRREQSPDEPYMALWQPDVAQPQAELWLRHRGRLYPSFLSSLCFDTGAHIEQLTTSLSHPVTILPKLACGSGASVPFGKFISPYQQFDRLRARTISLSLEEASALNAFPKYVLIGANSQHDQLVAMAGYLASLETGNYFAEAWWGEPALRVILCAFVLVFMALMPRVRSPLRRCAIFAAGAVIVLLGSLALASMSGIYISPSMLLVYACLIFIAYYLRQIVLGERKEVAGELSKTIDQVFDTLMAQNHFEQAMALVVQYPDYSRSEEKLLNIFARVQQHSNDPSYVLALFEALPERIAQRAAIQKKLHSLRDGLAKTLRLKHGASHSHSNIDKLGDDVPETLGRYRVDRELGHGAVGRVFLGFDPAISRQVAIKTLDTRTFSQTQIDDIRQRFFREAEAAGRLSHANIVSVHDVGEQGALAYIAMDYVDGSALNNHVTEESLLPVDWVYKIVHDVAMALAYAHERQIIHRDIKPGNIMLSAEGKQVKVADFGIARFVDHSRTATGEILGSPLYMSPEQLRGSKVEATADIFSLGVTFYQLLSGELPFNGHNLAALTYDIIHSKHKSVRTVRKDLPASAVRICNQCLQKMPHDRYQSAQELVVVMRKAIKRDFPKLAKELSF